MLLNMMLMYKNTTRFIVPLIVRDRIITRGISIKIKVMKLFESVSDSDTDSIYLNFSQLPLGIQK